MIQKTDLRIGNRILNVDNEPVTVDELREEFYIANGVGGQFYSTSKGIELSPELLEKCGFKWNGDKGSSKHYFLKGFRITMPSCNLTILRDCQMAGESRATNCGTSIGDRIEIKSLHQLQNLYFALTQTELTLSL